MICDKKEVYFFQNHFAHKSINNRMLAKLLEAKSSFHERIRKKRFSHNVPNKLSFLKIKIIRPGVPENQKESQFLNQKSYITSDFDFDCVSGKKQPRNKKLNRQILI